MGDSAINSSPVTFTDDRPGEVRLALNEALERLTAKYTLAQTDTTLKSVPTGQRFVVTALEVFCDNANVVDVQVVLEFAGAPGVKIVEHPGIAPGSGFVVGHGAQPVAVGEDGQDLIITTSVATNGSVCVQVSGYLIEA